MLAESVLGTVSRGRACQCAERENAGCSVIHGSVVHSGGVCQSVILLAACGALFLALTSLSSVCFSQAYDLSGDWLGIEEIIAILSDDGTIEKSVMRAADLVTAIRRTRQLGIDLYQITIRLCYIDGIIDLSDLSEEYTPRDIDVRRWGLADVVPVWLVHLCFEFEQTRMGGVAARELPHALEDKSPYRPTVVITGRVYMRDCVLDSGLDLCDVLFANSLVIHSVVCNGLFFQGCQFVRTVSLSGIQCNGFVSFEESVFHEAGLLKLCRFQGVSDFEAVRFEGMTMLEGCTFTLGANFDKVAFLDSLYFSANMARAPISLSGASFHDSKQAASMYHLAMLGCQESRYHDEADHYYRLYMRALRSQKSIVSRTLEWALVDLTTAYGTSWVRTLGSWALVISLGTLILWGGKGICTAASDQPIRSFWLALYFCIVTFTTLGYGDYRPRFGYKVVATIIALIGAFMMALFVAVFARNFMR